MNRKLYIVEIEKYGKTYYLNSSDYERKGYRKWTTNRKHASRFCYGSESETVIEVGKVLKGCKLTTYVFVKVED